MSSWFMTQTAQRVRKVKQVDVDGKPVLDSHGKQLVDEQTADLPNSFWVESTSSEANAAQEQVVTRMLFYNEDPDVDLLSTDVLVLDGVRYEVDSDIHRYRVPESVAHAECQAQRVKG